MKIMVTARHFDLEPSFKDYVEAKVDHLTHYFDRVDEAHVVLETEGHRNTADVTVHASRAVISSEQMADDMRTAFDRAIDKVERQLRRYKSRLRDSKRGESTSEVARTAGGVAAGQMTGLVPEGYASRPMTPEDAFLELEAAGASFLVFQNSETNTVNVIYRRTDGDYGLLEPVRDE